MQMQKFSLRFRSPSLDLGNSLSTTSIEPVLDMTRTCPFIFQTTQIPFSFRVLDSFMTAHCQLFQILPLFHSNNNNRLWNSNTVTELAIWKITVLIFIHVSTVIKPLILHTDASEINVLQEKKIHLGWIASWQWASIAKKIFQSHVRTFYRVLNSLAVEFSSSSHLVFDGGKWWSSTSFKVTSSEPKP